MNNCDCNCAVVSIISMSRFACLNAVLITRFLIVNINARFDVPCLPVHIKKTVIYSSSYTYIHWTSYHYCTYTTFLLRQTGPYTPSGVAVGAGFGVPPRDSPSFTGWI